MYKKLLLLAAVIGILLACSREQKIRLTNPLDSARIEEPVLISRMEFEKHFGPGKAGLLPFLKTNSGEYLPIQWDDLNGDKEWDEIAFLATIEADSSLDLEVEWLSEEKAPNFTKRTQVFLGKEQADGSFKEVLEDLAPQGLDGFPSRYQAEGVSWENDKMAFRIYFDCRNVKDLFGKRIPDLIANRAGTPEFGSYHNLADWGMDVLHCGSSLGAGGLALLENDRLYRLGSTTVYQYKELIDGPVRSIFELHYEGWQVGKQELKATERITIWAGKYWFQSDVSLEGINSEKELVTGIVTTRLDRDPISFRANQSFTAILAHGKQSLNADMLAMAVLAPTKEVTKIDHSGNTNYFLLGDRRVPVKSFSYQISETYYLCQRVRNRQASTHYFFAFWGLENPKWNEADSVKEYIENEANLLSSAIQIIY